MAAQIAAFRDRDRGDDAAAAIAPVVTDDADGARKGFAWMPSPRAAAAAVICMLGLGVVIGSATSQIAQSAGLAPIIVEIAEKKAAPPPPQEEPVEAAPAPEPVEEVPVAEPPAELPSFEPLPEGPGELPPEEPELVPFDPEATEEESEEALPDVKHVFVIMLGENSYEETFGATSQAPYLAKTLPEQGELLTNFYGAAKGKLANQVALLSGQGPTEELSAECPSPTPVDVTPGTVRAGTEETTKQIEGNGCVFPAAVETLPGQLEAKKLNWKAYVEEAVPGTPDPPYCARPFALFHSLLDNPECVGHAPGLPQLAKDLKALKTTPAFSYVIPNRCHEGSVEPCAEGQPTGPVAAEPFLKEVVPKIVASKAYEEDGLLIITSAQAPQLGATPDSSSCCGNIAFPNLAPLPEEVPVEGIEKSGGGGKVGMLLLSKFVTPGSRNETTTANAFALLLTLEELFELEKLGYANEPALLPFDSTVFNYAEEEEEAAGGEAAK